MFLEIYMLLEQKIVLQYLTIHFLSNVYHYKNQTGLFNKIFSADSHVKLWRLLQKPQDLYDGFISKNTYKQAATVNFSYVVL